MDQSRRSITRRRVLATVWPIVLANSSAPLLGLVDTAVIGHKETVEALGAIAIGGVIFSFIYWSFGFLRMATTGFVAQADGAGDEKEIRLSLFRPLLLGLSLGAMVWLLQYPIEQLSFFLIDGSPQVEGVASEYLRIRIWGAPAALAAYAIVGTLIGLEQTRRLMVMQIAINAINIVLDILFAGFWGMGVAGVALGTVIAEWAGLGIGAVLLWQHLRRRPMTHWRWAELWDRTRVMGMLGAQTDIMLRTMMLLGGFAWFTNQSAGFGDATLAGNHVLLQLVSFSAFVLDGFAFATESMVGKARGAADRDQFDRAVRLSSELALLSAVMLALFVGLGGHRVVAALTDLEPVRAAAGEQIGWAALYILLSVGAFQLDGVFIGVTRTKAMRNASFWSLTGFLVFSWILVPVYENTGLWLAFIGYVVLRAVTLAIAFPRLRQSLAGVAEADPSEPEENASQE